MDEWTGWKKTGERIRDPWLRWVWAAGAGAEGTPGPRLPKDQVLILAGAAQSRIIVIINSVPCLLRAQHQQGSKPGLAGVTLDLTLERFSDRNVE